MKKIRYTVRLYKIHDLDLITFLETHEFNFIRALYSALTAFCNGELFVIEVPPTKTQFTQIKRSYTKVLTLDAEKDAAAIAILDKLAPGYRNNFLKNILRQYLCFPLSEEFLKDSSDMDMFLDMFQIFRHGKKIARAGKIKKQTVSKKKTELNSVFSPNQETKSENTQQNHITHESVVPKTVTATADTEDSIDDILNNL